MSYFCHYISIGFPMVILPLESKLTTRLHSSRSSSIWEAERIEGRKLKKMAECSLIDGLARFQDSRWGLLAVRRRHGVSSSSWSVSVEWLVVLSSIIILVLLPTTTVYILVSQQHIVIYTAQGTKIIKLKQQLVDNETQLVRIDYWNKYRVYLS